MNNNRQVIARMLAEVARRRVYVNALVSLGYHDAARLQIEEAKFMLHVINQHHDKFRPLP